MSIFKQANRYKTVSYIQKKLPEARGRERYSCSVLPDWRHTAVICPEHEIAEALGVAVAVNAGAALVHSTRVMDVYKAHQV